jgi:hypothetical protein
MRKSVLVAAIVSVLTACGSSSTGPSANISGQWTINGTFANGSDSLYIAGTVMSLTQAGSAFSGGYTGGIFTCVSQGSRFDCTPSAGQIIDGQVSGSTVTFAMDTTAEPFRGTLSASAMTGTGVVITPFGTLSGTWGATEN